MSKRSGCEQRSPVPNKIGTRFESSLHRDLKFFYAGRNGRTETEVAGFVADGVSAEGEFIEVQTGSFGPLKKKISKFIAKGRVRIVYPIIITKYIEVVSAASSASVFNPNSGFQYRRKSPRRGSPWDLFNALIYAPELPLVPGLAIELVLVDAVERRVRDGKGSWRRKGLSIKDRRMTALHGHICLEKISDYLCFVPFEKDEPFTSGSLGKKAGIHTNLARKTLYVLTKIGVVERIGKQRNLLIYKTVSF